MPPGRVLLCGDPPDQLILDPVNMVLPRQPRIAVEIVFDFVCPWCYLGVHRFQQLRARRQDLPILSLWRPFLLNPDMPRLGISRSDYTARKFGDEERARRFHAAIAAIAAEDGLSLEFPRIERTPSSVDAHRLVRLALEYGPADNLVLAIFRAYFTEGRDIGDLSTLVRIAAACDLPAAMVRQYLAGDRATEQVHADNLHAHSLGINGVPCFVIDGATAIAGAQEPDILERLVELAASETILR